MGDTLKARCHDYGICLAHGRIFEERGLNPEQPPKTFSELDEISKKLYVVKEGVVTLLPFNFNDQASMAPLWWLYAGGGEFLSEDGSEIRFTGQKTLETMNFLRNYITSRCGGPQNMTGGRPRFLTGEVAMYTRGNSVWGEVMAADASFSLGIGVGPKHPDSQWTGATRGGWYYAVPAPGANRDEALKLFHWLTIPKESAGGFVLMQSRPSPIVAYNRDRVYYQQNPKYDVVIEALMTAYPITRITAGSLRLQS